MLRADAHAFAAKIAALAADKVELDAFIDKKRQEQTIRNRVCFKRNSSYMLN
jgi:hypothetical protein